MRSRRRRNNSVSPAVSERNDSDTDNDDASDNTKHRPGPRSKITSKLPRVQFIF